MLSSYRAWQERIRHEKPEPMLAAEAKARQKKHGGTAPGKHSGKELPKCSDDGKAAQQAAKLLGTNRQYVAALKNPNAPAARRRKVRFDDPNIVRHHLRASGAKLGARFSGLAGARCRKLVNFVGGLVDYAIENI